jgi:uncharacterized protein
MSGLRIDVTDLLGHQGARREVALDVALDDLGGTSARITAPVHATLVLERIPDGIVARGTVESTWRAECSICLRELEQPMRVSVNELFEADPVEGETYPIDGAEIDVEQLVRDALLLDLPLAPHCEAPCEPVAVSVGVTPADTPPTDPDSATGQPRDPRWAALSELDL